MTKEMLEAAMVAGIEMSFRALELKRKVESGELDPATITPEMIRAPTPEEIQARVDAGEPI